MPRLVRVALPGTLALAAMLACNLSTASNAPTPAASETSTEAPTSSPGAPTVAPSGTPVPASATVAIVHKTKPGIPGSVSGFLVDAASQPFAAEKRSIGDDYNMNLLERPFTSASMDYQPFLDIKRAEISAGAPWIYITIFLQKGPDSTTPATYAVELDVNLDGRGDWLITAQPASGDWSTDGVRIYQDANHDVGGAHPVLRDDPPQTGDGYEKLVFDQGNGPDPDAAWARISPSNPDHIQIAFNPSAVGSPGKFMWGVLAQAGGMHPEWFDYNDHWTLSDAGSPIKGSPDYPLKGLASVDSSCRWSFGFKPTGSEPGVCPVPQTPTPAGVPGPTPTPTPIPTKPIA